VALNQTRKGEPFGFRAVKGTRWDSEREEDDIVSYSVRLPHQCDAWVVGVADDPDELAGELMRFIHEAYVAYDAIVARVWEEE